MKVYELIYINDYYLEERYELILTKIVKSKQELDDSITEFHKQHSISTNIKLVSTDDKEICYYMYEAYYESLLIKEHEI